MGGHPKLEGGIVRWLDGSCRPASDLEAELFAEIATLTRDLEQARLEIADAIDQLARVNDERPSSLAEGIRLQELDLNSEHERTEAAEARLSSLTQAIRADELQQLRQLKGERK